LGAIKGEDVSITKAHKQKLPGVMMFFTASAARDVDLFKEYLRTVQKGPDFLRRFREAGTIIELPSELSAQAKVMQAIANAFAAKPDLELIEARVLLYFANQEWEDTGELKGAVSNAMAHVTGSIMKLSAIADFPDFHKFIKSAGSDHG
jgi:hypothetical protein